LAFEKDNLEAAFIQLICTTQASQSPTNDNYSSPRGVCGSKGRSHRPCKECPPVHSGLPSFLALWTSRTNIATQNESATSLSLQLFFNWQCSEPILVLNTDMEVARSFLAPLLASLTRSRGENVKPVSLLAFVFT
jgi:hypothetical protein